MRLDRLLGIVTVLLQQDQVTAPYLAEKFEVSRRTILRDIDAICMAGIPVVTTRGGRGGISILKGYKLDKRVLTTGELQSILDGLSSLAAVPGTASMERLLHKLAPEQGMVSLQDSLVIDLSSYYGNSLAEKISLLREAIAQRRLVCFDYYGPGGKTHRRIEPYFIAFKWSAWYVLGYCGQREDFRLFKLNRLWNLRVTDELYQPREVPEEQRGLEGWLQSEQTLTALFDPAVEYRLIEDYGPASYEPAEDGRLRLTVCYANRDYIVSWLLGFGELAEVVAPGDLRAEVARRARALAQIYSGT